MNLLSLATMGMVPMHNPEGGNGGDDKPPGEATIGIELDAQTGKPKAEPESAWVKPGGTIRWSCAEPFVIVLKLLWTHERVTRSSKKDGDMHVLEVTAGAVDGRYSYGISVQGNEVDPDVIIGPKRQVR